MNWYKIAQEELWIAFTLDGKFKSEPLPKEKALEKQKSFQSEGYPSRITKANNKETINELV